MSPAPVQKGSGPLKWILIGCGGLVVFVAIVITGMCWWGAHKIKNYAEMAQKNPAVAVAKLMVAANPDLEIVSQDDEKGTLTIHNKKTGEEITMNADDIKQGRLKFKNEKGEEVTFEGSSEKGKEGLTVKSKEGIVTIGGGTQPRPSWVPSYPGSAPVNTYSRTSETGIVGSFSFQTDDPSDKVLDYFENELKTSGFTVEKAKMSGGAIAIGSLHAKRDDGKRMVNISIVPIGNVSQVTVQYETSGGLTD